MAARPPRHRESDTINCYAGGFAITRTVEPRLAAPIQCAPSQGRDCINLDPQRVRLRTSIAALCWAQGGPSTRMITLILRLQRFDRAKEPNDPLQLSVGCNHTEINAFHHCLAITANKLPSKSEHSMMEVCTA